MRIDVLRLPYPERIALLAAAASEDVERELLCLLLIPGHGYFDEKYSVRYRYCKTCADVLGALKWPSNVMVLWERVGRGYIDDEFRACPILPEELRAFLGLVQDESVIREILVGGTWMTISDWSDQPLYSKAKRVK